jgi:hypothetical protein
MILRGRWQSANLSPQIRGDRAFELQGDSFAQPHEVKEFILGHENALSSIPLNTFAGVSHLPPGQQAEFIDPEK